MKRRLAIIAAATLLLAGCASVAQDRPDTDGYIRSRSHPDLPFVILNYTEKAQYERVWTRETRNCRGLIVNHRERVIARPWAKFFNYGEYEQGKFDTVLDLAAPVQVTDKMDGSLGILYPSIDGGGIATRGSFASEQAIHATALYHDRYADHWTPRSDVTYLYEIIYPSNRIVLDYAGLDDLVLLGGVITETGRPVGPDELPEWPGPTTVVYDYPTLAAALAAEPRTNAEGLVVRFLDTGLMVKIKQADYVSLHKLVTGLNEKVVWEHLAAGTLEQLITSVPDEFHQWVHEKARVLTADHDRIKIAAHEAYWDIIALIGEDASRAEFAAEAKARAPLTPYLFNLLDDRSPSPGIWKTLRPRGDTYMLGITEDVA